MEIIIYGIIGIILYKFKIVEFIWYLVTKKSNKTASPQKAVDTSNLFNWPFIGDYDFDIVGESFNQSAIAAIANSDEQELTAVLTPYSSNPYDDKAVKVEINGLMVGHLSKEDARSFRRRLSTKKISGQATATKAIITGGHKGNNGDKMSYGVQLDLKPFDN